MIFSIPFERQVSRVSGFTCFKLLSFVVSAKALLNLHRFPKDMETCNVWIQSSGNNNLLNKSV